MSTAQGLSHKAPVHRSSSDTLVPDPPESGTYMLLATDGVMAWREVALTTVTACVDGDEATLEVVALVPEA